MSDLFTFSESQQFLCLCLLIWVGLDSVFYEQLAVTTMVVLGFYSLSGFKK